MCDAVIRSIAVRVNAYSRVPRTESGRLDAFGLRVQLYVDRQLPQWAIRGLLNFTQAREMPVVQLNEVFSFNKKGQQKNFKRCCSPSMVNHILEGLQSGRVAVVICSADQLCSIG